MGGPHQLSGAKKCIPKLQPQCGGEGEMCRAGFWPRHPLESCVALAKTLPSLGLSFSICKMGPMVTAA